MKRLTILLTLCLVVATCGPIVDPNVQALRVMRGWPSPLTVVGVVQGRYPLTEELATWVIRDGQGVTHLVDRQVATWVSVYPVGTQFTVPADELRP